MSVGDARVYTCTRIVHDKLSCTRLHNYTIGASLMSVSVSVGVGPVEFQLNASSYRPAIGPLQALYGHGKSLTSLQFEVIRCKFIFGCHLQIACVLHKRSSLKIRVYRFRVCVSIRVSIQV